jgi:serine/threonine kinase 4
VQCISNLKQVLSQPTGRQGSWRDKEKLWIVMEYCGGGSVSDLIQANGNAPLDEEVIAYICKETLAGLAYLHSIGKVPC